MRRLILVAIVLVLSGCSTSSWFAITPPVPKKMEVKTPPEGFHVDPDACGREWRLWLPTPGSWPPAFSVSDDGKGIVLAIDKNERDHDRQYVTTLPLKSDWTAAVDKAGTLYLRKRGGNRSVTKIASPTLAALWTYLLVNPEDVWINFDAQYQDMELIWSLTWHDTGASPAGSRRKVAYKWWQSRADLLNMVADGIQVDRVETVKRLMRLGCIDPKYSPHNPTVAGHLEPYDNDPGPGGKYSVYVMTPPGPFTIRATTSTNIIEFVSGPKGAESVARIPIKDGYRAYPSKDAPGSMLYFEHDDGGVYEVLPTNLEGLWRFVDNTKIPLRFALWWDGPWGDGMWFWRIGWDQPDRPGPSPWNQIPDVDPGGALVAWPHNDRLWLGHPDSRFVDLLIDRTATTTALREQGDCYGRVIVVNGESTP